MTDNKDHDVFFNGTLIGKIEATGNIDDDSATIIQLLKEKGLHEEFSEVKTLFRQALSFATTAAYLHKKDLLRTPWNVHSVAPFVVNSVFSMELYLKLLAMAHGKPLRGHDLSKLFQDLPPKAHEMIQAALPNSLKHWKPHGDGNVDVEGYLAELANAFVDWRYLHEKRKTDAIHIDRIIFLLSLFHEACKNTLESGPAATEPMP